MKEIVVISGKGGTGKTTLTASFAGYLDKIVIADCDVDAANLHLILHPEIQKKSEFYSGVKPVINQKKCTECGLCLTLCKYGAISSYYQVNEIDCEGCGVCSFLCPENAIELVESNCGEWYLSDTRYGPMVHAKLGIAKENSGKLVNLIRKEAKLVAEKEDVSIILVDGAPGIGCPVISSITNASLVVIVTEPTVSGIHDLKRIIELIRHFGIQASLVINKYDINEKNSNEIEQYATEQEIPVIGKIPYDLKIVEAMVQGKILNNNNGSNTGKEIEKICATVKKLCA